VGWRTGQPNQSYTCHQNTTLLAVPPHITQKRPVCHRVELLTLETGLNYITVLQQTHIKSEPKVLFREALGIWLIYGGVYFLLLRSFSFPYVHRFVFHL
jgi:hypothetical protein